MKKSIIALSAFAVLLLTSCLGSKHASASGGEVTGVSGRAFTEPTPHGMTLVKRGHLKMGIEKQDSLWGKQRESCFSIPIFRWVLRSRTLSGVSRHQ